MRVLHVGAGNIYGGIERAMVSYAAGRNACGNMEQYFGLAFPGQVESELRAEAADVTILGPARLSQWRSIAAARSTLLGLFARCRPDVVVTHGPWAHCVFGPTGKRSKIPIALFFHNPPSLSWLDVWARRIRPGLVLTNSQYTLAQTRWWLGSIPAVTCTYPIGPPHESRRIQVRSRLGIPADKVLILQVSRLDPYKGHRLHLRALAELQADPRWCAWFVGSEKAGKEAYRESLVALRGKLGLTDRVRFLGHRTDVADLMDAADIFCHPNTRPEPFGIAFVEAMQAGLPVVATTMGGANEIVGSEGGLLVPPTTAALAAALRDLVANSEKRADIGRRAREISANRYTVASGVRELAGHLSKLCLIATSKTKSRAWA